MVSEQYRQQELSYLPPREMLLIDPDSHERIPTPLNDLGLVDTDTLIDDVKSTVDPSYKWAAPDGPDIHHLYWPQHRYLDEPDSPANPHKFREIPSNKILLPYAFHRWLQWITEPPPVPSEEIRQHLIEAQLSIVALYAISKQSVRLTRGRYIREGKVERGREKHLELFSDRLERAQKIPREFQLIDFSDYKVSSTEDIHAISPRLGEFVARRTTVRVRDALRPIAL